MAGWALYLDCPDTRLKSRYWQISPEIRGPLPSSVVMGSIRFLIDTQSGVSQPLCHPYPSNMVISCMAAQAFRASRSTSLQATVAEAYLSLE